jgi:hypothetical protein
MNERSDMSNSKFTRATTDVPRVVFVDGLREGGHDCRTRRDLLFANLPQTTYRALSMKWRSDI